MNNLERSVLDIPLPHTGTFLFSPMIQNQIGLIQPAIKRKRTLPIKSYLNCGLTSQKCLFVKLKRVQG